MAAEWSTSEARERFSDVLKASAAGPVHLTSRGRRRAVVLSTAEYERLLLAAEDAEDLAEADAAMAAIEAGTPTIPWEQVKADLGLA